MIHIQTQKASFLLKIISVSRADSFKQHRDVLKGYMKRYEELEEKIKKSENFDIYRQYYQITHKLLFLL